LCQASHGDRLADWDVSSDERDMYMDITVLHVKFISTLPEQACWNTLPLHATLCTHARSLMQARFSQPGFTHCHVCSRYDCGEVKHTLAVAKQGRPFLMTGGLPSLPACTPTNSTQPLCHMQGLPTVQSALHASMRITQCWCYGTARFTIKATAVLQVLLAGLAAEAPAMQASTL
jgi:hypothetical protein